MLLNLAQGQWVNGYEYRKPITIPDTSVSGGIALDDFPLLVSLTDANLRTISNGGNVENASGYDIVFASGDGTLLGHELESYNAVSGELIAWVNVPSVSPTTSTVIYMYYGNDAIATDQSSTSAWVANYGASWNMSDLNDGTANGYSLTDNNSIDTTGKIGRARYVDGSGTQYLLANEAAIGPTSYFTLSFWMRPTGNEGTVVDFSSGSSAGDPYFYFNYNNSNIRFAFESAGDDDVNFTDNTNLTEGEWYHVICVGEHDGNDHRIYLNGIQVASDNTNVDGKSSQLDDGRIGDINTSYGTSQGRYNGSIDNFWIYNGLWSDDFISTLYKNQNNPSAFITVGNEECNANDAAGTIYGASQVASGTTVNLTLSGYNQLATFQWQSSTDGTNFSDIPGETGVAYTTPAINQITYYRVQAQLNSCTDYSDIHTIFLSDSFLTDYYYRKNITLSASMVCGGADLSNFPVYLNFTDPDLATAANKITNNEGYDIVFTQEDGQTLLDHQLEKFDSTTGEISAWVRIPTLSATSNTVIVMNYGNCNVATDQSTNSVWTVDYEAVYHLGNDITDQSQNSNDLTNNGSTVTSGITGDARHFNGTSHYLTGTDIDLTQGTISAWVKFDNTHNSASSQTRPVFNNWQNNSNQATMLFAGTDNSYNDDGKFYFKIEGSGTFGRETSDQSSWTGGTWYYVSASFGTTQSIAINGETVSSSSRTNSISENIPITIGGGDVDQTNNFEYFEGVIDEVHITSAVRNDDWLCTEYRNLSNPGAYITLGTEESNFQWSGAVSSDWSNGSNWTGCHVPESTSDIVISSSASNYPVISTDQSIKSITIENGASLTVNNATLTVTGDFTIDGSYACTNGKIRFAGSATQNIFGAGTLTFCDLEIANTASGNNLVLNTPIQIEDSLILTDGVIRSTASEKVTLPDGAVVVGGKTASYVDGPFTKIGDDPFDFPVGRNGIYGEIGISDLFNAAITDEWTAEYFREELATSFSDSSSHAGENDGIYNVSQIEYWDLSRDVGSAEVKIALNWRGGNSAISDLTQIVLAHNVSGNNWSNERGTVTGTVDSGCVVSEGRISSFSPFTFGSTGDANPLPIELAYFLAEAKDDHVVLKWQSNTEINNDRYEIQRSATGEDFETIATVPGAGDSKQILRYQTEDRDPLKGTSFYRLKQVDRDGSFFYSSVQEVSFSSKTVAFTVYPNPNDGRELNVLLSETLYTSEVAFEVYDVYGRLMFSDSQPVLDTDHNLFTLMLAGSGLSNGVYTVVLTTSYQKASQTFYVVKRE